MDTPRISVIIPAKNERESLEYVLNEIPKGMVHEIIVVDGHSTDGTPELVRRLGYRVVQQEGAGYGMGVITGIKVAEGNLITFIDADGSYDPEALTRLLQRIEDGYDVAFCSRYRPESGSDDDDAIRLLGNKLFTLALRLLFGVRLTDALFFYALGKREMFENLELTSSDFSICVEIPARIHKLGYRYTEIPSRERRRIAGESKVNAFIDGLKIIRAMAKLLLMGNGNRKVAPQKGTDLSSGPD